MMDSDHLFKVFARLSGEGHPPFRWQMRLLRHFLAADLPAAVDVPTGLGKTAVMALWLIALGAGALLPRRLIYVVDRRAVVDQATRFAERLRCNLPVHLAHKLRLDTDSGGLPISTLRGGFTDNRDWLEDPSRPAIVVGTIDMVGSRLLFEGYGVSRGMRPYHAGLLGVDALVLLDEAHLCPPFEALLRQVAENRDGMLGPTANAGPPTPPFRLIALSATGREMPGGDATSSFKLEDADRQEPVVRRRLTASKRLQVTELTDPQALPERIANRAIELGDGYPPARVLVYCHSRKDAVAVKAMLDKVSAQRIKQGKRNNEPASAYSSELLVGERRVYERTTLEMWLEAHGFLGGMKSPSQVPIFLVATSAGEVGVDLDADHLVCDLAAWERMVQRLGRVNRRGDEERVATIDVFAVRPEVKANARSADREKQEQDLALFERRLAPLRRLPRGDDDRHDASPAAIGELKDSHPTMVKDATTPEPLYPEVTRPLLDAWSMTSLERHEGRPEVAPWLRGWDEDEEPYTNVVWRKYLPCQASADDDAAARLTMVADYFRCAPVHATEELEAVSSRVLDWLLARVVQLGTHHDDHDLAVRDNECFAILIDRTGKLIDSARLSELRHLAVPAKHLSASVRRRKREWKERLLPGKTLVVDARICGLRDGMLDEKSAHTVPTADADERWRDASEDPSSERSRPLIKFRVEVITGGEGDEGLKRPEHEDYRHVRTFETHFDADGRASRGLAVLNWHDDPADEDFRSILSAPQALNDHVRQVADRARELARRLDLPDEEIEAFAIAASLHDDGKAAARWQDAMNAPADGRPYAKTRGGGNWRLLEGYRHEFASLLKAERQVMPDGTRDLILHLIASHHGNARPLISAAGCDDGPPSLLEAKAGAAALRFARLSKRYGPWGLAWREAILRAADQSASRE